MRKGKYILVFAPVILFIFLGIFNVSALNNGLALTPPMGWNSWNVFHAYMTKEVKSYPLRGRGLLIYFCLSGDAWGRSGRRGGYRYTLGYRDGRGCFLGCIIFHDHFHFKDGGFNQFVDLFGA